MKFRPSYKHLYTLLFISIILSFFVVKFPIKLTISSITLYLSAALGYAGIMLLLWTFILGCRSVIMLFSNDYAKVIKLHSLIAKYGMLLIFLHPVFVMISYGESLPFLFVPNFSTIFENAITYGKSSLYIIFVIWISSAFLKSNMKQRPWKYLHLAAYVSVPFALLHIPFTGSSYNSTLSAKIYFFITVIGFALFGILRLRGVLNLNKFKYKIISQQQITPDIFEIKFKPINEHLPTIKPGQYIYIKQNWIGEDHPFSMLNYNSSNGEITIGYKVCGLFTKKLSTLPVDKQVYLSGPFGNFTDNICNKPVVYIAGGIGIAPFYYRLINEGNQREQWLFYVNKTRNNSAFSTQIKNNCGQVISIYSREPSLGEHNTETGHLQPVNIKKYLPDPNKFCYYICGPIAMINSTVEILKNCGISDDNIHAELFSF